MAGGLGGQQNLGQSAFNGVSQPQWGYPPPMAQAGLPQGGATIGGNGVIGAANAQTPLRGNTAPLPTNSTYGGWAPAFQGMQPTQQQTNTNTQAQYPSLFGGYWNQQSQMGAGPSYTSQQPGASPQGAGSINGLTSYLQSLGLGNLP